MLSPIMCVHHTGVHVGKPHTRLAHIHTGATTINNGESYIAH